MSTEVKPKVAANTQAPLWRFWLLAVGVALLGLGGFLLLKFYLPQPATPRRPTSITRHSLSRHGSSVRAGTPAPAPPPPSSTGVEARASDDGRAATATETLARVLAILATASPQDRQTAERFMRFAATGHLEELQSLSRAEVEALAQRLTDNMPADEIASRLEKLLGLPKSLTLERGDAKKTLVDLYDAALGATLPAVFGDALTFTDNCDANGTVTGNVDVLPAGAKRVYAVFANADNLVGRDTVLAVWRNPGDDQMVFTETEPIRRDAPVNYVWLQADDGWPSGAYQLELCDPKHPNRVLARRPFTVR